MQELLKGSLGSSFLRGVHEVLLMSYVTVLKEVCQRPEAGMTSDQGPSWKWLDAVRHMDSMYLTTGRVWLGMFGSVAGGERGDKETERILEEIYGHWRAA